MQVWCLFSGLFNVGAYFGLFVWISLIPIGLIPVFSNPSDGINYLQKCTNG